MGSGRHGLTVEQIYQLAEFQEFKCPLSGMNLVVRDGEIYDPTTNKRIAISNIPQEVYTYLINGKTPIEWVMDRYMVKEDSDSGNINDPNEYSDDPKYVFNLLLSVITMSREILSLQNSLPKLVIPE